MNQNKEEMSELTPYKEFGKWQVPERSHPS